MKIYIVFQGMWDNKIGLITNNLKEAFEYSDKVNEWTDIREYEIQKNHFTRPERPKN